MLVPSVIGSELEAAPMNESVDIESPSSPLTAVTPLKCSIISIPLTIVGWLNLYVTRDVNGFGTKLEYAETGYKFPF